VNWTRFWKARSGSDPLSGNEGEWPGDLRLAIEELGRLIEARPELALPGEGLARMLRGAFAIRGSVEPSLEPGESQTDLLIDRIREGWREGAPAARVVAPAIDQTRLLSRAKAVAESSAAESTVARNFCEWITREPDQIASWAQTMLGQGEAALERLIPRPGVEPSFACSVLRLILLAELRDWTARIMAHLDEGSWPRGDCPVCGAWPALAESRGLEQKRFLRCDCCGADWPGNRLQCTYCGETDHRSLRSHFAEGEQNRFRLAICMSCGGRLKVIATLKHLSAPGLLVAQLAMVHLDCIGAEESDRRLP
jgi:hypothetical protein